MPYAQTLIDNFDDNSFDTTKWTKTDTNPTPDVIETSSHMTIWASSFYPVLTGKTSFDLSKGIFAINFGQSGSAGAETEFYFGLKDGSGNKIGLFATPSVNNIDILTEGATTVSSKVITDNTAVKSMNGGWLGIGNIGSDGIFRAYKSTDKITWTEIARGTVGGTFNKTSVVMDIYAGRYAGTSVWVANLDDASYFQYQSQTLIDDFNDNSLDVSKWKNWGTSTEVTESSQKFNIKATIGYPSVDGLVPFDLSTGIFGVKYSQSGVATSDTEFYIGTFDGSGNRIYLFANPIGNTYTIDRGGAATVSNIVKTDTTIGLGPSWVNGTWLGFGNLGIDGVLRFYKSTDAVTWTEIARCTVGGTFNKANAKLWISSGLWENTVTWVGSLDDASFFPMPQTPANPKYKVRVANAWTIGKIKVRVGGAWVTAKPKVRVGGAWVTPKSF